MSGPYVLLTQGPRIAHLSSDAELKIGSHVAEPAIRHPGARTGLVAVTAGSALDAIGRLTVAADMGGELVCPAARHRKLWQLAELIAYTGLASESRDLAGAVVPGSRPQRIVRKLECGASALVPTRRRPAPRRPRQASCQARMLRTIRDAPTHRDITSNGARTATRCDASMPVAFTVTGGRPPGRDGADMTGSHDDTSRLSLAMFVQPACGNRGQT
jgi:hypothetical protein